jgi:hypothetical protein
MNNTRIDQIARRQRDIQEGFFCMMGKETPREIMELTCALIPLSGQVWQKM